MANPSGESTPAPITHPSVNPTNILYSYPLTYYCELRWLPRAKVIQRVSELKEDIATFLEENHHKCTFVDER
jgi:hypothetical protein